LVVAFDWHIFTVWSVVVLPPRLYTLCVSQSPSLVAGGLKSSAAAIPMDADKIAMAGAMGNLMCTP
jgi:hypothetical protein